MIDIVNMKRLLKKTMNFIIKIFVLKIFQIPYIRVLDYVPIPLPYPPPLLGFPSSKYSILQYF